MLGRIAALVLRCFIGAVLVATAIGKGLDVPGFAKVIDTYQVLAPWMLLPAAIAMPLIELALGLLLLSGLHTPKAAWASFSLHLVFIAWISVALLRGLNIPNCGCFGVFMARPLTPATVIEDGVMLLLSAALAFIAARAPAATWRPGLLTGRTA